MRNKECRMVGTSSTRKQHSSCSRKLFSNFPKKNKKTSSTTTSAAAPTTATVIPSMFYGTSKKRALKEVDLLPLPMIPQSPSGPPKKKKKLKERAAESETMLSLPSETSITGEDEHRTEPVSPLSNLGHGEGSENGFALSPTTADNILRTTTLTPEELQYEPEEIQERYSPERTGSSPLYSPTSIHSRPSFSPTSFSDFFSSHLSKETEDLCDTSSRSSSPTVIGSTPPTLAVSTRVVTTTCTDANPPASTAVIKQKGDATALRRSEVWDYFNFIQDGRFAKCKLCGKEVSRGRKVGHYTNSGMKLHLKNYHHSALLQKEAETVRAGSKATGTVSDFAHSSSPPNTSGTPSTSTMLRQSTVNIVNSSTPKRLAVQSQSDALSSQGRVHQPTLENFVGFSSRGMSKQQANKITRLIAQFIAVGGASFLMIEGEPFRQLMHALTPQYVIPSRTTFSRNIVPALYHSCVAVVKENLAKAEDQTVHFTTDLWTAPSGQHAFLSLTAHWWQPTMPGSGGTSGGSQCFSAFKTGSGSVGHQGYRSLLLHTEVMDEKHTAENILQAIKQMVENWLGEQADTNVHVGFVVSDGAANMVKALRDGAFVSVRCSAHILHLVVKGAISEGNNKVSIILDHCRKIAGHFHRSVRSSQILREEQEKTGLPTHRLRQDVATRWNSTLEMLERILEQQIAIHNISSHHFIGIGSTLGREEWTIIAQLVSVLKPFRDTTENLSQNDASLGQVIPLFMHLVNKMDAFLDNREPVPGGTLHIDVSAVVRKLKELLKGRLNERVTKSQELMLASLCDPRIKGKLALRANSLTYWKEQLIKRIRNLQQKRGMLVEADLESTPAMSSSPSSCTTSKTPQRAPSSAIWTEALGDLVGASTAPGNREESSATEMVRAYLYEPPLPPTADPLTYWDVKKSVWPALCLVAQQLLSCPPTSVQSERVFSITGNILNPQRSKMSPELMEQIAFLKFNLPKLGYPTLNFRT
uniref:BED-type domain-containing protein n=1 Tax=Leptobrachium leishanense TaxID=445787 RepID=A0A8C5PR12_9ANUR